MKRIQLEALQWIRDCSVKQACGSPPFTHATLAALLRRDLATLEHHHTGTRCWALTDKGRSALHKVEAIEAHTKPRMHTLQTKANHAYQTQRRMEMRPARHRRR